MRHGEKLKAELFVGGGEMGAMMRSHNWSSSQLGPVESWPRSLRLATRILLGSGYPMYIAWGPHFTQLYNDAYRPILGTTKHPYALGHGTQETFPEIWEFIGPMFRRVLDGGGATTLTDQPLFFDRDGYQEEFYYTFSYSPIPDDDEESTGGVLVTCMETTDKILEERRLRTLRDFAAEAIGASHETDLYGVAGEVLRRNPHDVPFALLYLADAGQYRLAAAVGIGRDHPLAAEDLDLSVWPIAVAQLQRKPCTVDAVSSRFPELPCGGWTVPPNSVALCPMFTAGQEDATGFLLVGLNPYKRLDDKYSAFLERLAGQFASSVSDVRNFQAERERAEVLTELDRAKTTFFSNISHEFRTPLTLMLGPLEEVVAAPELSEPVRDRLEIALRNSLRLLKLVNNLLEFSRLEAGRVKANYVRTDLAAFTAELASGFRSAMERAGLKFEVRTEPERDPVYVDRDMWERIVLNLLSNAFKFTLQGQVVVEQRQVGEWVELTVQDSGAGIPQSELPNVFKRFHRIEGTRGRSFEGSGIGLALVQELTKLHAGSITVASAVDEGSTFTVRIPIGRAHLAPQEVSESRDGQHPSARIDEFTGEALRWIGSDEPVFASDEQLASILAPTQHTESVKGARVLVVDDNADMRDYVSRLLSQNFLVSTARDGGEALRSMRRERPDLVLSDVMMPGIDGLSLLREIRSDVVLRTLPVILLSARAGEEAEVSGLETGADDYLTKPFTARELLARVTAHLEIAKLRMEGEQRAAREAARVTEILESTTDAVFMLDRKWRFTYLNRYAKELIAPASDIIGRVLWEEFPAAVERDFYKQYHKVIEERVPVEFEEHYPAPLDRWYSIRAYPTEDGMAAFFRDVTERRRAEKALRENEKLAAAGRLAASIAHEINNPLEAVTNLLYLIETSPTIVGTDREYLKTAQVELARVSLIASRTLRFYRQSVRATDVKLEEVIDSVIDLFERRLREQDIRMEKRYRSTIALRAYAGDLRQIFANLVGNALDATAAGGRIVVDVRDSRDWKSGARGLRVTVADTGHGMDLNTRKHLFEPFFTTKETTGTGLGLWVSRELIEKHRGTIRVRSSKDHDQHGTVFFVFFPTEL